MKRIVRSEEWLSRQSAAQKANWASGRYSTEDVRIRRRQSALRAWAEGRRSRVVSAEQKEKQRDAMRRVVASGMYQDAGYRARQSAATREAAAAGRLFGPDHRAKISAAAKALVASGNSNLHRPEVRARAYAALKGPTRLELDAAAFLQRRFPDAGWRLNREAPLLMVGTKTPDIVRSDGLPLVVDMHGDYWHRKETADDVLDREFYFGVRGFTLVVVWEHQFRQNPEILTAEILAALTVSWR